MPSIVAHLLVYSEFDFIYVTEFHPVNSVPLTIMSMRVQHVLSFCRPLQVRSTIVLPVSVNMINLTFPMWIWNECRCDDPMNLRQDLTSILTQIDR
jgi:hypothetical protein